MNHKGTVRLETERLILRRIEASDAKAAYSNWTSDSEVTKYLTWKAHESLEFTREFFESLAEEYKNPSYYHWIIELKDGNIPIGIIGGVRHGEEVKSITIGYCIGKAWWSKSFTTEALNRLIKFLFEEVEYNRIELTHDPQNIASGKVMQKAGLKLEGTRRQAEINNTGLVDSNIYAILREDYKS